LFLHSGVESEVGLCNYISNSNDYYVIAFDHTGHGRSASDENRGHVEDWRWFIKDATQVLNSNLKIIRQRWADVPFSCLEYLLVVVLP